MLSRKRLRCVCVKAPVQGHGGHAFAPVGRTMDADIQPMSGDLSQRMYGLTPSQMRRMICAAGALLCEGDGVCVEVPADAEPDFRVVYTARWGTHTDAHLRFIPEAERGADE